MQKDYDIIVVGGGHAGAEAVWAAANLNVRVGLVTLSQETIAQMSCNPAIGGVGKGQIVREIDALGGIMGLAADATGIQYRMLNASKGPAVRGPRCQSDRHEYATFVQDMLATKSNLEIIEGIATDIITENNQAVGLTYTPAGSDESKSLRAKAIVITAGTFLRGIMHCGPEIWEGGRIGERAANELSVSLEKAGVELARLKTGTCPRIDANTIDYSKCTIQKGDNPPVPFSFMNPEIKQEQIPCWITETNADVHDLVSSNFHQAPMYTGQISSEGPRYCPSFETKLQRFPDKNSHQIFIEPEGRSTNWIYLNGISTSMPRDIQKAMINNIRGLEDAIILQYGYAIEYDFAPPEQLFSTLETKCCAGLYLAGQLNGTTGYEEAGALGMIAAVNAVRKINGQDEFILRRDQAYIGVMIDDLITKGVGNEPYRMFTSRAEHRLSLRADNADRRLTEIGREIGTVDDMRWSKFFEKANAIQQAKMLMQNTRISNRSVWELMRRPNAKLSDFASEKAIAESPGKIRDNLNQLAELIAKYPNAIESLEIDATYSGYIEKQAASVAQLQNLDMKKIPADFDYHSITQLRHEARQKLSAVKPANLGQALRVSGITPADITVLAVHLARRTAEQ